MRMISNCNGFAIPMKRDAHTWSLTRYNISLVQTQLTTLQNLIRPIRFWGLVKVFIHLLGSLLRGIKVSRNNLQVVMMSLMNIVRYINVSIERPCRFQESIRRILKFSLDKVFREWFAKTQMIDNV